MLANGILALGCKPVMADDPREVLDFTKQSQALFINLGHLSAEKEKAIRIAASYAAQVSLPMVVDAVGVTASSIRKSLVKDLLDYRPTVLKGNMSEIRSLVGLKHHGVGVDASAKDQETEDLLQVLKDWCQTLSRYVILSYWPQGSHRFRESSCCIGEWMCRIRLDNRDRRLSWSLDSHFSQPRKDWLCSFVSSSLLSQYLCRENSCSRNGIGRFSIPSTQSAFAPQKR